MRNIVIILIILLLTQSRVFASEITFKQRITHPIATLIQSFAWIADPFYLCNCFGMDKVTCQKMMNYIGFM